MRLGALLRLAKNLRGVIYVGDAASSRQALYWVKKKFQYRAVGYTRSGRHKLEDIGEGETLGKNPFRRLLLPAGPISELVDLARDVAPDPELAECMLLASLHISPLFILSPTCSDILSEVSMCSMDASPQEGKDLKKHLRILNYAILDSHGTSSPRCADGLARAAREAATGGEDCAERLLGNALDEERELAEADCEKRFWRLEEWRDEDVAPTVFYLHPLRLLRPLLEGERLHELDHLMKEHQAEVEPCLNVMPAHVIRRKE
ncbi:MAG: hypothetical protein V5A84_05320 [Planctomycetota bacterium]